mmetsp:Transcript_55497/g.125076  ORF Transcript_55497/g.125076 Transcript_55497/m.125076 type:complete len:220 (+) Transcript_55497:685-1344(+)
MTFMRSIRVVSFSTSVDLSSCLALVSASSLSQCSFWLASASASSWSRVSMSVIRPLTFLNGSRPFREAERTVAPMRTASCESTGKRCCLPYVRSRRTTFAMSLRLDWWVSCKKDSPPEPYSSFSAAPVFSLMAFLAAASALSSSFRAVVSASKSSALDMHSWWRSVSETVSTLTSLEVTERSPSETALLSPLSASPFLDASRSWVEAAISSFRDCFSSS